jgi:hypothetical protein
MEANGGNFAGDDLVPTDATDFSATAENPRGQARSGRDQSRGNQTTNFLKQYAEFGLTFRSAVSASTQRWPGRRAKATSSAPGRWCGII